MIPTSTATEIQQGTGHRPTELRARLEQIAYGEVDEANAALTEIWAEVIEGLPAIERAIAVAACAQGSEWASIQTRAAIFLSQAAHQSMLEDSFRDGGDDLRYA